VTRSNVETGRWVKNERVQYRTHLRLDERERPAHSLFRARRRQQLQARVERVLERGDEQVREPVRRRLLEHGLQPPRRALAVLEFVHERARVFFEARRHVAELAVVRGDAVIASVTTEISERRRRQRVELPDVRDEERRRGRELIQLEPASALEQQRVRLQGRSVRANVGVEFKGVRWELKGVEGGR